jgi:hypothetical protein
MKNDFSRFAAVNPRIPEFLSSINDLVDQTLAQGAPLQSVHRIDGSDALHYPWHRNFTLVNVEGSVTALDLQCDRRIARLPFAAGAEWQIPESWGNCALRILGADGTGFAVIEFE